MRSKIKAGLKKFFFPPVGSPRWVYILPYAALGILSVIVLVGGVYGWEYSNSPQFCGTVCHTMPPQNVTYLQSPHANVSCEECHIGRASLGNQLVRKSEGLRELYAQTFKTYHLPLIASRLRPARETCETCHLPEAFQGDKLKVITHFDDDKENTFSDIYLILKTGGGSKQEGLGRGIHWHIVNKVDYYETDALGQTIPYVRVHNDDGTISEYVDVESDFDPKTINPDDLRVMDCTSCHNRISHNFKAPVTSMDEYMSNNLIDPAIPEIHLQGVKVLSTSYATQEEAFNAIASLEDFYKANYSDYYAKNPNSVKTAVSQIQKIFSESVFIDQKVNWESHPNNAGHVQTAGCFRCHDGKHLDANQHAIRLECNLCHSIPVVTGQEDFVATIEISRGPEPASHLSPNWISMHNQVFDQSCSACHDTSDAGLTTNTSFCSNSACHGSTFTYAGFDAPKLRSIIQSQLPTAEPEPIPAPTPVPGTTVDYAANIEPLFAKCTTCHNATMATGGLDLSSYASMMTGGKNGPVLIASDSENSLLISVQSEQHFANFTADELELIRQWINAGALEK